MTDKGVFKSLADLLGEDPPDKEEPSLQGEGEERTAAWRAALRTACEVRDEYMRELEPTFGTVAALDIIAAKYFAHQVANFQLLDARLAALEAKPSPLKYVGVWKRETQYEPGSFVTYAGALWHANIIVTGAVPGDGNAWTLAVKSGRNPR